jgi:hypothetical protein
LHNIQLYDVGAIPVEGALQLNDQFVKLVRLIDGELGLFGIPNALVFDTDKLVVVNVGFDKYVDM